MTANVFPYPNDLPPGSQAFARETIKRIETLESNRDSAGSDQNATNKGLAASLQSLSEQVRDLVGRISYQATDNSYSSWNATTGLVQVGPTLTFTLTEARVVSITFMANFRAYSQTYNAGTYTTLASTTIVIDGSAAGGVSKGSAISQSASNAGGLANNFVQGSNARVLVALPAGTHTVRGALNSATLTYSGSGTGAGSVEIADPAVYVDVMQPA